VRYVNARRSDAITVSEIGSGGGGLRLSRWLVALVVGCALVSVLWTAGAAHAASRKWTVHNYAPERLTLVSVTPYQQVPMEFEGRPADGSVLSRYTSQYFELKYGLYDAVLKYKIENTKDFVEFWIGNVGAIPDARCRFIRGAEGGHPGEEGDWAFQAKLVGHVVGNDYEYYCYASPFVLGRLVAFTGVPGWPAPAP
jgi:hypothetical protein